MHDNEAQYKGPAHVTLKYPAGGVDNRVASALLRKALPRDVVRGARYLAGCSELWAHVLPSRYCGM